MLKDNKLFMMMKVILRKDRVSILVWSLSLISFTFYVAIAMPYLFPSEADLMAMTQMLENPAMISMLGPIYGGPDYTFGAIMAAEMLIFTGIAVAVMNILLVTKHTRRDEEDGLIELIQSLPVKKTIPLKATLITYGFVNLIIGLIIGIPLELMHIESMDMMGSIVYGLTLSAIGIIFVMLTGLMAQLSSSSRGTLGLSFLLLGLFYMMRAIGDISSEALSLVSPLGLMMRSKPYVDNSLIPLTIMIFASFFIGYVAISLNMKRDLDAGFLPQKNGKAEASKYLSSPFGLIVKLQKNSLVIWAITVFILGASYGSILGDVDSFLENNSMYGQLISNINENGSVIDQFVAMLHVVIALFGTIPVLNMILKLRKEEKKGRLEHLISRSVTRNKLMTSYLTFAFLTSILMSISGAMGLFVAGNQATQGGLNFVKILEGTWVYLPAVWGMIGLSSLLIGIIPKWTKGIWFYLTFSFISIYFGGLLKLPDWVPKLSPYGHVPQLPVDSYHFTGSLILIFISAITIVIGISAFSRRDLDNPA
ncbi:MAG: ABC transporter permease [Clostridia bacterium]|nr:ABC transporter permease [Clostridia bacterium]